jgi:hypothetical protein
MDGLVIIVLGFAVVVSNVISSQRTEHRARRDLEGLAEQVLAFRASAGAYPRDLSELGWRLYEVFETGTARDPWGRAYDYQPPGKAGESPSLRSAGPDPTSKQDDLVKGL